MNCTKVLPAFSPHPPSSMMPVDLAMCLSLSQREPLYQLLSLSPVRAAQHLCQSTEYPHKTSLYAPRYSSTSSSSSVSSSSSSSSSLPLETRSCMRRNASSRPKKNVVFADAKGLALTAVRLFTAEPSSSTSSPELTVKPSGVKLQSQQPASHKLQNYKLRLGFLQPTLDFKGLLARLRESRVQLESCSISDMCLSGKVRVMHVSFEQAVHVRVTFDSWRNYRDVPCTFLQQQRGGASHVDIFAFDLNLPQNLDPKDRVEFCVSFKPEPGATPHWDDNRGQNYRVLIEKNPLKGNHGDSVHGCSTLSKHRTPSWPSHLASLGMQSSAEYLKRTLSSRVGPDWRTLCPVK